MSFDVDDALQESPLGIKYFQLPLLKVRSSQKPMIIKNPLISQNYLYVTFYVSSNLSENWSLPLVNLVYYKHDKMNFVA